MACYRLNVKLHEKLNKIFSINKYVFFSYSNYVNNKENFTFNFTIIFVFSLNISESIWFIYGLVWVIFDFRKCMSHMIKSYETFYCIKFISNIYR